MTKLLSLLCALVAAGVGVWSMVIAHGAVTTLDQARAYYVASGPAARTADVADRPAVSGGADAALPPQAEPRTGEVAPLPLPPPLPAPSRDRADDDLGTPALSPGETPVGSRPRPAPAPAASPSTPLGYTLPQARPDAVAPAAPAGAPAGPAAVGPQ